MTSKGYRPHAQAAGYGLRWLIGTRREEIAISTLMRAEIARRLCRCLQATYGRSQLRERAVRPLEISLVPGIVLICPWGRERRPGAGDVSPSAEACASKACPKQGVCPASRSSHTIPAHHPGRYHPTSGSPHPRGVLLISSRISRASPAGAARPRPVCTGSLTTPNGAPHRPRSRICALLFT